MPIQQNLTYSAYEERENRQMPHDVQLMGIRKIKITQLIKDN